MPPSCAKSIRPETGTGEADSDRVDVIKERIPVVAGPEIGVTSLHCSQWSRPRLFDGLLDCVGIPETILAKFSIVSAYIRPRTYVDVFSRESAPIHAPPLPESVLSYGLHEIRSDCRFHAYIPEDHASERVVFCNDKEDVSCQVKAIHDQSIRQTFSDVRLKLVEIFQKEEVGHDDGHKEVANFLCLVLSVFLIALTLPSLPLDISEDASEGLTGNVIEVEVLCFTLGRDTPA